MDFSMKAVLVALVALLAVAYCADSDESKVVNKRETENTDHQLQLEDDLNDLDKRRIFRYGRGVFRYGKRAPVFRYGKRGGSLFRYGKRDDDQADAVVDNNMADFYDTDDVSKRIFRYGKRADSDSAYKRLFRWGKRDGGDVTGNDDGVMADSLDEEKRIFRYGKREDDADDLEAIKRKVFRFGKREDSDLTWGDLTEEQKRQIFRYGRDTRAPQTPHVPFRFGDEE